MLVGKILFINSHSYQVSPRAWSLGFRKARQCSGWWAWAQGQADCLMSVSPRVGTGKADTHQRLARLP